MSETKLNLRQKLVKVYTMIDHVEKSGRNTKQNYNFVKAADVLRSVRDAFATLGIYAETNYELLGTYDIKTNSGGNMHTATVKATIVLHDCDSPETMTISGLGDGADSGDKGIYKAMTGATKNALRNGSLMPDEADPEADQQVDQYTDFRGTEVYAHPDSTMEMPDFQDAKRGTEKPARPTAQVAPQATQPATAKTGPYPPVQSTETRPLFGASVAAAPSTMETAPAVAPKQATTPQEFHEEVKAERGDAWEGPEVDRLPTEEELVQYRARFTSLSNDLSAHGKLTASKGLKLNTKLLVFFLSIAKADAAKNVSVSGWESFFQRVDKAVANPEVGLIGLTKLINKANGLETKE